jgi:hypothetical protein
MQVAQAASITPVETHLSPPSQFAASIFPASICEVNALWSQHPARRLLYKVVIENLTG